MAGWERYEAIKHAQITSHTAFMAMKFGDEELNSVVDACFKPAVARSGFELKLLTDSQPAGLIDDQLRVALRTSRFVIATSHMRIMVPIGRLGLLKDSGDL